MERAEVIVKVGAEGLVCAGLPGRGIGVAIKIEDGSHRALDPAIVRALRLLDALPQDAGVEPFARPPVLGGGRPVGELVSEFELRQG
jgi:L-asparaginase II